MYVQKQLVTNHLHMYNVSICIVTVVCIYNKINVCYILYSTAFDWQNVNIILNGLPCQKKFIKE